MGTSSVNPSHPPPQLLALHATQSAPSDMQPTSHSKSFAASRAPTSSTRLNHTIAASPIALRRISTISVPRKTRPSGTQKVHAWTRVSLGSVAICGSRLRKMELFARAAKGSRKHTPSKTTPHESNGNRSRPPPKRHQMQRTPRRKCRHPLVGPRNLAQTQTPMRTPVRIMMPYLTRPLPRLIFRHHQYPTLPTSRLGF